MHEQPPSHVGDCSPMLLASSVVSPRTFRISCVGILQSYSLFYFFMSKRAPRPDYISLHEIEQHLKFTGTRETRHTLKPTKQNETVQR